MNYKHDKKRNNLIIGFVIFVMILSAIFFAIALWQLAGSYWVTGNYVVFLFIIALILFSIGALWYLLPIYFDQETKDEVWLKFHKMYVYTDGRGKGFTGRNKYYVIVRSSIAACVVVVFLIMLSPKKVYQSSGETSNLIGDIVLIYVVIFAFLFLMYVVMNIDKNLFQFGFWRTILKTAGVALVVNIALVILTLILLEDSRNFIIDVLSHLEDKTSIILTIVLGLPALFISYIAFINRGNLRLQLVPHPQIDVTPIKEDENVESRYHFFLPKKSLKLNKKFINEKDKHFKLTMKITNRTATPISQLRFIARSDDYQINPYIALKQGEKLYCDIHFNLEVSTYGVYRLPLEVIYKTVSGMMVYREQIILHFNPENIDETETIIQKTSIVLFPFFNKFLDPCLRMNFGERKTFKEHFTKKRENLRN